MRISGGTMFGYCATGRPNIVTNPTTTCKMAMTIATIGRLMKKRYITTWTASLLRNRRRNIRACRVIRLRIDYRSLLDPLPSLGDDPVVGLQPAFDQPIIAQLRPHL